MGRPLHAHSDEGSNRPKKGVWHVSVEVSIRNPKLARRGPEKKENRLIQALATAGSVPGASAVRPRGDSRPGCWPPAERPPRPRRHMPPPSTSEGCAAMGDQKKAAERKKRAAVPVRARAGAVLEVRRVTTRAPRLPGRERDATHAEQTTTPQRSAAVSPAAARRQLPLNSHRARD